MTPGRKKLARGRRALISPGEHAWRKVRRCIRCHHSMDQTHICVEVSMAKHPGSTGLLDVRLDGRGRDLTPLAKRLGRKALTVHEAVVAVDQLYRRAVAK